jgi:hypothetical protein
MLCLCVCVCVCVCVLYKELEGLRYLAFLGLGGTAPNALQLWEDHYKLFC